MSSHPLTHRMASLLERIHRAKRPPLEAMTPQQARAVYEQAAEVLDMPRAALARVEPLRVPGPAGAMLPARLYVDHAAPAGVLLYLHGGGFTIGSLETHDSLCRQLALRSGAAVLALDYRLAPEHRFPTAVEDAWAALRWLFASARDLGLAGARIAVGGDSAGATLAAVCALLARDQGLPLAAQLLITPGTAAHGDWPSRRRYARGALLDASTIEWMFRQYLDDAQRHDWRFAPLEAESLDGAAPAALILAECDPLLDEGLAYGDRLRSAGVPVELELFRGVTHDFIKMGRSLPEAGAAQAAAAEFLRTRFETA